MEAVVWALQPSLLAPSLRLPHPGSPIAYASSPAAPRIGFHEGAVHGELNGPGWVDYAKVEGLLPKFLEDALYDLGLGTLDEEAEGVVACGFYP